MKYASRIEVVAHHMTGHYANQCCYRGGWRDEKARGGGQCDCRDDAIDLLAKLDAHDIAGKPDNSE